MKKILLIFCFLITKIVLYSHSCDTIDSKTVVNLLKSELNYYELCTKADKNKALGFFIGVDLNQLLTYLKIKSQHSLAKISFYSNDSLVCDLSNFENINFIWLLEKRVYKPRDTLRFSESKSSKKINLEDVFEGYKYLNPKKIVIGANNNTFNPKNPALTLFVFSKTKLILVLPKITRVILYKEMLNNN